MAIILLITKKNQHSLILNLYVTEKDLGREI